MTKKKNNFRRETHFMFLEDNYWQCWMCGMNTADCGHHIFGRGKEEGCEKSPFNYAPMCNHKCHLRHHGRITTAEGKKRLLEKTINFLEQRGYRLTDEDNDFLNKYGREIYNLGIQI